VLVKGRGVYVQSQAQGGRRVGKRRRGVKGRGVYVQSRAQRGPRAGKRRGCSDGLGGVNDNTKIYRLV
jgi:hypothetical protein